MPNKFEVPIGELALSIETGLMAKQSDGSVTVKYGDTIILATAVAMKQAREGIDFFPLTVDYQEKTYSAGKIPGGFFKREGRPSEKEILSSRLIDRPIRPLFPDGFFCETQGIVNVLSLGEENVSDVMGIIGVSAALTISDIPFDGPVGAVRVGRHNGDFIINPPFTIIDKLDLNLAVAGTDEAVMMVEGGALEANEADMLHAIDLAHAEIKKIVKIQREMRDAVGKPKRAVTPPAKDEELHKKVYDYAIERIKKAITIQGKLRRQEELDIICADVIANQNDPENDKKKGIKEAFNEIEKKLVREMILNEGVRSDGRKSDEVRAITAETGFLPRAHGSALFIRGETQSLVVSTLGTVDDQQIIDALEGEYKKTFMLHYNFPPFSVGEVKFLRGPGRREIGHGALAERAIRPMLPSKEEFPYTIRIVSDILESNGSSSMATVCGSSLSLMDCGVPVKAAVAGIAMGLVMEGDKSVILTDILGLEDHLGDMDFKVAGTSKGITAFQMDCKISGISRPVMERALEQARKGRLHILDRMNSILAKPKPDLSEFAPRIYTMTVKQDKIREVIGSGGKVIRGIQEQTGVKINIEDSGVVTIASNDAASARKAISIIEGIVEEAVIGRIYTGTVKKIMDFGAFVEIIPGTEGLVHISQIADKRIEKVTDVLQEGDTVIVKVLEIDRAGKIRLSRKEAMKESGK